MTDVLCDYCGREWSLEQPFIEGHQGSCICGRCLTIAYREIMLHRDHSITTGYKCRMCLEGDDDRAAQDRADEPGWQSPVETDAHLCRRCIKLASGALHKDKDYDWRKPEG